VGFSFYRFFFLIFVHMSKPLYTLSILLVSLFSFGQPNKGLVAKFTFNNGNSENEINHRRPKIVGSPVTSDRFGNPKSARFFHGNFFSYMNLGTYPELKPESGSVSVWFKIDNIAYNGGGVASNPIILTKSQAGDDFFEAYCITYEYELHRMSFSSTNDQQHQLSIRSSESPALHEWHHAVMAYDDHHMWAYVDGVLQNDGKPLAKNFKTKFLETDSVMLGNMANCKNERFFSGSIDDVLIYNRVLSQEEVLELYNAPDPNRYNIYFKWFYRILILAGFIILIVWLILRKYRNDLEKQKETNRLNARLNELETKAIRTQMNPHFIFNSLNTLQRFILEEDIATSNIYLTKFSKLLRKLLESSTSDTISLKEEMDILNSYIEIEKLRFDNSFEYEITCNIERPESVYVPFMLVQPFVENAIWHGLLPKKGERFLVVKFSNLDEKRILCVIEDNGVGRNYSAKHKDPLKKKSLAIEFIKQRLELLEKSTGTACSFKIIDKNKETHLGEGTIVEIIIPKLN
jgi:hypothetical protein